MQYDAVPPTHQLDTELACVVLSARCGHVEVPLRRLGQARLLWLNRRAACRDPKFRAMQSDLSAYGRHVLASCAFVIDDCSGGGAEVVGHADRYGGAGIGRNGGSGRNVFVNGYLVKGAGRTPLVSALTPPSHASGGAYLEECVREAIFSEIVALEFPCGAVDTLAIIDTGLVQVWDTAQGPKTERRTLLVRPAFVRPAHFERAVGFASGRPFEGARDHRRVEAIFDAAGSLVGMDKLAEQLDALGQRWSHQLAYAFVHRLPHGSNTSSNISLDGRLVDFGAMTAVPSWSNTATSLDADPFVTRFTGVEQALRSLSYYFGRHLAPALGRQEAIEARVARSRAGFERAVTFEALRLCGVPDRTALDAVNSRRSGALGRHLRRCIAHYQAERIDMVEGVELPVRPWNLSSVWDSQVPAHLVVLKSILRDLVPAVNRDVAARICRFAMRAQAAVVCTPDAGANLHPPRA